MEKTKTFVRISESVILGMTFVLAYLVAGDMGLIPDSRTTTYSLGVIFLIGVVASVSTTMATTGALYLNTIGKLHNDKTKLKQRLIPIFNFNAGRIFAYIVMGALNGYLGQLLARQLKSNTVFDVIIGIFMVIVGLEMLHLFPFKVKKWENWFDRQLNTVGEQLEKKPRRTSFILGIISYWLPCAFTNTVQFYALGMADPWMGALVMGVFALASTPALFGIGLASTILNTKYYEWFMKIVGVLITLIGLSYIYNPFKNL